VERSATCPLCKTELWDEEDESSDEDTPSSETGNGWRRLIDFLSFAPFRLNENPLTATRPHHELGGEDSLSETSWWRRWLSEQRGRPGLTFAEQHGVALNALSEPLLQAENGQVDSSTAD
jgi:hypothetical protein